MLTSEPAYRTDTPPCPHPHPEPHPPPRAPPAAQGALTGPDRPRSLPQGERRLWHLHKHCIGKPAGGVRPSVAARPSLSPSQRVLPDVRVEAALRVVLAGVDVGELALP